jgi:hypothetical protein
MYGAETDGKQGVPEIEMAYDAAVNPGGFPDGKTTILAGGYIPEAGPVPDLLLMGIKRNFPPADTKTEKTVDGGKG